MTDDVKWTPDDLRGMSLGELLDEWDEPLPAEARAVLMSELEARGYRTSSLEVPPDPDPGSPPFVAPTPAEEVEATRERRVRNGSVIVLIVGLFTLLAAVAATFVGDEELQAREARLAEYAADDQMSFNGELRNVGELRAELKRERAVVLYVPFALAGAFLALYFWSRSSPKAALTTAFVLYVALQGLALASGSASSARGLVVPVLVAFALGAGALAAWSAPKPAAEGDEFWEGV